MSAVLSSELREKVMREYRAIICSLLDTNSPEMVENASLSHAAVILEEMARHATKSFFAIAHTLNPEAWNPAVVQSLADAQQRGVDIELLVTETDETHLAHLQAWDEGIRSRVMKISDKIKSFGLNLPNFSVMDEKALRFEVDKQHACAMFCANVPERALIAESWFKTIKQGALPLQFV